MYNTNIVPFPKTSRQKKWPCETQKGLAEMANFFETDSVLVEIETALCDYYQACLEAHAKNQNEDFAEWRGRLAAHADRILDILERT
jgi:hypothetical protein